jgi:hypothetical protein
MSDIQNIDEQRVKEYENDIETHVNDMRKIMCELPKNKNMGVPPSISLLHMNARQMRQGWMSYFLRKQINWMVAISYYVVSRRMGIYNRENMGWITK